MAGLISVIMLTLNEEENLPGALEHLRGWADEVFVVDSLSTDRTVDIALEAGAMVVQRPFTNFGDQWNFALHCLPISSAWTMKMDPDERLSVPLMEEITEALRSDQEITGYSMDLRLWFMGEPLHAMGEVLRIWRTGSCQFSDVLVNEHLIIEGRIQKLKGIMEHLDSPTLHHWFEKQNRYTTMEAIMRMRKDALAADAKWWGSALERRMFLKKIFYRIPFRYSLLWLYEFFYRQAYRDGRVGLAWAHLRVEVMRNIEYKYKEMVKKGTISEMPKAKSGDYDPRILSSALQAEAMEKDKSRLQGKRTQMSSEG